MAKQAKRAKLSIIDELLQGKTAGDLTQKQLLIDLREQGQDALGIDKLMLKIYRPDGQERKGYIEVYQLVGVPALIQNKLTNSPNKPDAIGYIKEGKLFTFASK